MKQIICTLLAALSVLFCGWYAGTDMLDRGPTQAWIFAMAIAAAGVVYTYPGWKWNE